MTPIILAPFDIPEGPQNGEEDPDEQERSIPYLDILGGVEQAIRKLTQEAAEEVRSEVALALKRSSLPKPNITKDEKKALVALRRNPDIVILPADKGNATVLLKTEDYHQKVQQLLADATYRRIPRDPTDSIVRKTTSLMKKNLPPEEYNRNLLPQVPVPPRLYGLPKIHKENTPLRPIVSAIGAPTYNLAKNLNSVLTPFVGLCEHHVKNSSEFVQTLKTIKVHKQDILASFDVVSLFTKIPVKDTLELLGTRFDKKLIELFRHVLPSTYFQYQGTFYEQVEGGPMGSPMSPAIANFFMEDFEEKALRMAKLRPRYFFRYVDDTFIVWPHGPAALNEFLEHINSVHPKIRFTMEKEDNGQLPFLDILIKKREDGTLSHSVYRKPTHTDLYLNGESHHHPSQKRGVLSTLLHRAKTISDAENLGKELEHLKTTFRRNGHKERDINLALKRTFEKPERMKDEGERPIARACIPFVSTISNKIGRILQKRKSSGPLRVATVILVMVNDRMPQPTGHRLPPVVMRDRTLRSTTRAMKAPIPLDNASELDHWVINEWEKFLEKKPY
ncbi:uncharacterized protein [Hetaerina americana]|uniref:uncharacterized protein n=1 Tax=Hetaerina americana TaxID=62018 RepID=UPI003A7F244D